VKGRVDALNRCKMCKDYYRTAHDQIRALQESGCLDPYSKNGTVGIPGPPERWGTGMGHFHWCMSSVRLETIAHETRARADAVVKCHACNSYADAAENDAKIAWEHNCIAPRGWHPGRLTRDRNAHFRWCVSERDGAFIQREREVRSRFSSQCVREQQHAVECNKYATLANADQTSNLSGRCGFTGPRWQNNYDAHLSWCLTMPIQAANHELNIRTAMLGVCGREEPYVRCDGYARQAIAQISEATARRCSFGGQPPGRWNPIYEDHLAWCIGVDADFAASETRGREGPLSQCRTTNPMGHALPPPETCAVSVAVTNRTCLNADGTPSSVTPGSLFQVECGADYNTASQRAKSAFSIFNYCLIDGDSPAPGCCTYNEQATQVSPGVTVQSLPPPPRLRSPDRPVASLPLPPRLRSPGGTPPFGPAVKLLPRPTLGPPQGGRSKLADQRRQRLERYARYKREMAARRARYARIKSTRRAQQARQVSVRKARHMRIKRAIRSTGPR
jgi:hypothetical protein